MESGVPTIEKPGLTPEELEQLRVLCDKQPALVRRFLQVNSKKETAQPNLAEPNHNSENPLDQIKTLTQALVALETESGVDFSKSKIGELFRQVEELGAKPVRPMDDYYKGEFDVQTAAAEFSTEFPEIIKRWLAYKESEPEKRGEILTAFIQDVKKFSKKLCRVINENEPRTSADTWMALDDLKQALNIILSKRKLPLSVFVPVPNTPFRLESMTSYFPDTSGLSSFEINRLRQEYDGRAKFRIVAVTQFGMIINGAAGVQSRVVEHAEVKTE